jgi:hypothetical protein
MSYKIELRGAIFDAFPRSRSGAFPLHAASPLSSSFSSSSSSSTSANHVEEPPSFDRAFLTGPWFRISSDDTPTSALEAVQIDLTLVDVVVVDELERRPLRRPWLTLVIDVASRMVTGFYVSLDPAFDSFGRSGACPSGTGPSPDRGTRQAGGPRSVDRLVDGGPEVVPHGQLLVAGV